MAGKLHIHVMYLCAALLMAIVLLDMSNEGEAKPVLCPGGVQMGLVTSSQACTSVCKKKFGDLYYGSMVTNKRSGINSFEGFSLKGWLCCCLKKRRGKKSSSDGSDSDGGSSTASTAASGGRSSSGSGKSSSGRSSSSNGGGGRCNHC